MNKNKGFTLIELLAVVVVLAIIAFIATPIILGIIDKAKKGAANASALGYIDAVEKYMIISQLDSSKVKLEPGVYQLSNPEELTFIDYIIPKVYAEDSTIYLNDIIKIKGDKPKKGWVEVSNKEVENYSFVVDNFVITKDQEITKGDTPAEPSQSVVTGPTKVLGTITDTYKAIVYLDPTDLTKTCNESNSISTMGTKAGCMKWYAYKDDGTNYTMILDHNTTQNVKWSTTSSNSTNGDSINTQLNSDITGWDNSIKMTARIISANEIANIVSKTAWDESTATTSDRYYFDSLSMVKNDLCKESSTSGCKYGWLYDRTNISCSTYGCLNNLDDLNASVLKSGYWTSSKVSDSTNLAWTVDYISLLNYYGVSTSYHGVRPVITIPKSLLN